LTADCPAGGGHDEHNFLAVTQGLVPTDVTPAHGDDNVCEAAGKRGLLGGELVEQRADTGCIAKHSAQARRACGLCQGCAQSDGDGRCHRSIFLAVYGTQRINGNTTCVL
jgi:hypothetical protein